MGLGHKFRKISKKLGKKNVRSLRTLGKKSPMILNNVSKGLKVASQVADVAAKVSMATGQPELAAPLYVASKGLKIGSNVTGDASKASQEINDGKYLKAANTIQKSVKSTSKDISSFG
jgi:hypothetical protein